MSHDADVIIVGGGPVGMGLAIELGQRGVACTVVERYPEPQRVPKGQNLTQRTMEHFFVWGAENELRAARTIPKEYGIGGMTAYGTLLGGYTYDWMQRDLVRSFYFTANERLPQYATEEVLRHRAAKVSAITPLYGWQAEAVHADDKSVDVVIHDRKGGAKRTLRAPYVVGCDGSRSLVRSEAGLAQTRSDHDRLMVLLVFRSRELHKLLEGFPGKSYYNVLDPALEGYWKFFGRVDLGTTWFFHAPVPLGTTADNYDFRALLYGAAGKSFDVDFEHIGFWDLRFAVADSYGTDRLFIAGDAAHSHPPYGGYGINTGFEDARNLGWKLAATLKGWGGPNLLASYSAERQPVFASTANDFIEKAILTDKAFLAAYDPTRDRAAFEAKWAERQSGARGEVNAFEPNYEGSPIVPGSEGRPSALGSHEYAARAGHHLAPQTLSSGDDVFDHLGTEFTLLAFDADDAAVQAFERSAKDLDVPLKVITDSRADGRARYDAALILVRPDHFVAWAGDGRDTDAAIVIGAAVGR